MPSRIEKYRMKNGVSPLDEVYFNPIWIDIDQRLVSVEATREDYEASILAIQGHGLAQITAALQPRLDEADAQLAQLSQALSTLPTVASVGYVDGQVAGSAAAHLAAEDPHAQYLTPSRHAAIGGNPHGTTAVQVGAEPALGLPSADGQVLASGIGGARTWVAQGNPMLFVKADPASVAFVKTGAQALAIKAGTQVMVGTKMVPFPATAAVVMPALTAGMDYALFACTDGTCRADASFIAPANYTGATSRLIGGFHYGLVPPGTTPAGGGFNTNVPTIGTGSMPWTQADVDVIAGINAWSMWDLKFRPAALSPKGMVLVCGAWWVDLYLLGTSHPTDGTSRAGVTIATSQAAAAAKVHPLFGGNGTTTYGGLSWFEANEIMAAHGKALLSPAEFAAAMWGVTEQTSLSGGATTTGRANGFTSRYGCEQATGVVATWGSLISDGYLESKNETTDGRGVVPQTIYAAALGGGTTDLAGSGSRRILMAPADVPGIIVGARGRAAHIQTT